MIIFRCASEGDVGGILGRKRLDCVCGSLSKAPEITPTTSGAMTSDSGKYMAICRHHVSTILQLVLRCMVIAAELP